MGETCRTGFEIIISTASEQLSLRGGRSGGQIPVIDAGSGYLPLWVEDGSNGAVWSGQTTASGTPQPRPLGVKAAIEIGYCMYYQLHPDRLNWSTFNKDIKSHVEPHEVLEIQLKMS